MAGNLKPPFASQHTTEEAQSHPGSHEEHTSFPAADCHPSPTSPACLTRQAGESIAFIESLRSTAHVSEEHREATWQLVLSAFRTSLAASGPGRVPEDGSPSNAAEPGLLLSPGDSPPAPPATGLPTRRRRPLCASCGWYVAADWYCIHPRMLGLGYREGEVKPFHEACSRYEREEA